MRAVLSVMLLFSFHGGSSAAAQETTGDIQGRTLAPGGQPLADVQVTVAGPTLQGDRRTLSDSRGAFRLLALPPGAFTVRVTRIGYRPLVIEQVAVNLGHTTALGAVTLPEQVTELPPLVGFATLFNDTWAYDFEHNRWRNLHPANPPAPRTYHYMAYEPTTNRIVMFGGTLHWSETGDEVGNDETWIYSVANNSWRQPSPKIRRARTRGTR